MTALSAYIHIPFCSYKCDFCDFTAFAGLDHLAFDYCRIVCREIEDRLSGLPEPPELNSIFVGGGTPGLVAPELIGKILETVAAYTRLSPRVEITLETTPQSITLEKARSWLAAGINRLSVGVQSLNDSELAAIGRDHTAEQALAGLALVEQAGFTNISADLMYGLPEQTRDSFSKSLSRLLALDLPHMSAYGLQLSSETSLTRRYPRQSPAYPSDEQFAELYEHLVETTAGAGLLQYEISNFSKPGFQSTHNLSYWTNDPYFAFGVGAHRYVDGIRSSNWRSLNKYMSDWLGSETSELIDEPTRVKEAIFLALRTRQGINFHQFSQRYRVNLAEKLAGKLERLVAGGLVELSADSLRLSQRGVLVSNLVLAELI